MSSLKPKLCKSCVKSKHHTQGEAWTQMYVEALLSLHNEGGESLVLKPQVVGSVLARLLEATCFDDTALTCPSSKQPHQLACAFGRIMSATQTASSVPISLPYSPLSPTILLEQKALEYAMRGMIGALGDLARTDVAILFGCLPAPQGYNRCDYLRKIDKNWPIDPCTTLCDFAKIYLHSTQTLSDGLGDLQMTSLRTILGLDGSDRKTARDKLCLICLQQFIVAVLNSKELCVYYRFNTRMLISLFALFLTRGCVLWQDGPVFQLRDEISGGIGNALDLAELFESGALLGSLCDVVTLCKALLKENLRGVPDYKGCECEDDCLFDHIDVLLFEAHAEIAAIEVTG